MFKLIQGSKPAGLMARVLAGDSEAFRDLLLELRPAVRYFLHKRYEHLEYAHRDLANDAETLLFAWWKRPSERLIRDDEPTMALALRLVQQVARTESRYQERKEKLADGLKAQMDGKPPLAEEISSPETMELLADLESLSETHRSVLWAEIRYERGEGPPAHEVLGIDAVTCRQRLHRARAALEIRIQKRERERLP